MLVQVRQPQDNTGPVRVDFTHPTTGESGSVLAQYVLGCDDANSLTRTAIGATMQDLRFQQRWLVVDVVTDADLAEWEGVHQVCDTERAATHMRVGKNRYRWEFRLAAGETADDYRDMARLHPLISPWTKSIPAAQLQMSGSPSTPSARRSPTAGETAGSSCSATPRTSHHPSSARAWARGFAMR